MFSFFRKKETSSSTEPASLTSDELLLVQNAGVDEQLALQLKAITGSPLRALVQWPIDDEDTQKTVGIRSRWKKNYSFELQREIVKISPPFRDQNHQIFFTTSDLEDNAQDLLLIASLNPSDILHIFNTNGINWEVNTNDIVQFFERWQKMVPIQFVGVNQDSVDIHFAHLDFDVVQFFTEALVLCPDFESVSDDAEELAKICKGRKGYTEFWWD